MSEEKKYKGKTVSYPNRLLRALDVILQSETATIEEKLQAADLMLAAIPLRSIPKRKTDKEKAVLKALAGVKSKKQEG